MHRFYERANDEFAVWRDDRGFWVSQDTSNGKHAHSSSVSLPEFLVEGDVEVVTALEDFLEVALASFERPSTNRQ